MISEKEDTLEIKEAVLADLTKEDLIRLTEDKDRTISHMQSTIEAISKENGRIAKVYEKDMNFMSGLVDNVIKKNKTKEEAMLNILKNLETLMTIEYTDIAPSREEEVKND